MAIEAMDPHVLEQLQGMGFSTENIQRVYLEEKEQLERSPHNVHRMVQILADKLAETASPVPPERGGADPPPAAAGAAVAPEAKRINDDDDMLQRALAMSMFDEDDTKLQQAIAMSMAAEQSHSTPPAASKHNDTTAARVGNLEAGGSSARPAERRSGNPSEASPGDGNCTICREERCRNQAKCHLLERLIDAVTSSAEKNKIVEICEEAGRNGVKPLYNELCKRDVPEGRTALAYAVQMNLDRVTRDLIELGASVHQQMGTNATALTLAATNEKRDGTEMVRLLLSKRADPSELEQAGIDIKKLNITMQYWLQISKKSPKLTDEDLQHLANAPPMHKMHELVYAIVGERLSLTMFKNALTGWFSQPRGFTNSRLNRDPLVMLLLGCPGHGKTYISRNAAAALVGEDNYYEVACGSIRDDADLFGSNLGGAKSGTYSSKGQLVEWLRQRQGRDVIVFLDEFEKIQGLTSSLGWDQAKKIYQSFLEPWQEGWLSDTSSESGPKVDCSKVVWILTSNWGQEKIIEFAEKPENEWVYKKVDEDDLAKIKRELIDKVLVPEVMKQFKNVHQDVQALSRRINCTIPFLPFTNHERMVVTDLEIRNKFQHWRSPAVLTGLAQKHKLFGNLQLMHTLDFLNYAVSQYKPMEGASSISRVVEQVNGDFTSRLCDKRFQLSDDEWKVIRSDKPRPKGFSEPKFWVHYDEDDAITRFLQSEPESSPAKRRPVSSDSPHKSVKDPFTVSHNDTDEAIRTESGDEPGESPETSKKVNPFD